MKTMGRRQAITMQEIARIAGVSQSTVSRVLNGKGSVDPHMQAAVLKVIEDLNYFPNAAAQGLVSGRTRSIGVLTRYLSSPFFDDILRGIATGLTTQGYLSIMVQGSEVPNEDANILNLILSRQVEGLIVQAGNQIMDTYFQQLSMQIPLIVMGRRVPHLEEQCVYVDSHAAAYRATAYLIEKGHTDIAHIGGQPMLASALERREGYCRALEDHGLRIDPALIVEGDFTESSGTLATEKLLARRRQHPFSAIFVANDQMVIGCRLALYRQNIAVPDEISLVGFDDQPHSRYMLPPLTTVRLPAYQMGVIAAQGILALIAGKRLQLPELSLELIVRESVSIR
jgi:LacI family transcriptional regulator